MTLKVGLTGGIGSGKSLVAEIFKALGVPVFHADLEGRKIVNSDTVKHLLAKLFGPEVIDGDTVNRQVLAAIVFNDPEKLKKLNAIVHPEVRKSFQSWLGSYPTEPYIIYEAAILIESGYWQQLDRIILVTAPQEVRIQRVMQRDNVSREQVIMRMNNQWSDREKIPYAHFVIENDGEKLLVPQVLTIHKILTGSQIS